MSYAELDPKETLLRTGIKTTLKGCLGIVWSVYTGWVLSVIWGWFAVAILHLAPITVLMAIAIMLLRGILMNNMGEAMMMMAVKKHLPLDKDAQTFLDWAGEPFIWTFILVGCAFWHFLMFPLLMLIGLG